MMPFMTFPKNTAPLPVAETVTVSKDTPMTDATTNLVPDSFVRGSSNGYIADLSALGAIETAKDIGKQLDGLTTRLNDDFNKVNGLVTDSSFRTLEQFGISGVQMQKIGGELGVLVQKTTGELLTAVTLSAKDGIIDAAKNAAAVQLQAEKIASAGVLLATQIAAQASKEAAHCCCALKEKIDAAAEETRELLNEIERRHGDRREGDLKIELSNVRQTSAIERLLDERLNRFTRTAVTTTIPPV